MESKVDRLYLCETFSKYLMNDNILKTLISDAYFVDKPMEIEDTEYATYNYKLVSGGLIKSYQLQVNCLGKDLFKVMQIQSRIETLLDDDENKKVNIKDEKNIIRSCTLLNGGGQIFDDERKEYICISYFLFKI